jgi:DNA-binding response OmpR family regulator
MTTILLVEDSVELVEVIERELTAEGYRVFRAGDGLSAMQIYVDEHPDLVILD